jgi:hypothetical protein
MAVEQTGAAPRTAGAPEPHRLYHVRKAIHGICKEAALLILECGDAVGDSYERDGDHAGYAGGIAPQALDGLEGYRGIKPAAGLVLCSVLICIGGKAFISC